MYSISIYFTTTYFILFTSIINISFSYPDGIKNETLFENDVATEDGDSRETPPKCEPGQSCVSKCCPNGTAFTSDYECTSTWFQNVPEWKPPAGSLTPYNYSTIYGFPLGRGDDDVCVMAEEGSYHLTKSGRIYFKKEKKDFPIISYCIDYFYDEVNNPSEFAIICLPIVKKTSFDIMADSIQRKGLIFSGVLIFTVLILTGMSPRKRDLHLNCILFAFSSLGFAFVLNYINMKSEITTSIPREVCVFVGVLVQFTFLSFYFWLNVFVFNLAFLIRTGGLLTEGDATKCFTPRMKIYVLYAYGGPFIIACVTSALQFVPFEASYFIKPRIAEGRCWFADGGSMYAYFYGIEIALHIINIALMFYSWCLLKKDEVKLLRFRQTFWVVLLFLFSWILNSFTLISPISKISRTIDIFLSFQGIFIFLIIAHYQKYIFKDASVAFIRCITCADRRRLRQ